MAGIFPQHINWSHLDAGKFGGDRIKFGGLAVCLLTAKLNFLIEFY